MTAVGLNEWSSAKLDTHLSSKPSSGHTKAVLQAQKWLCRKMQSLGTAMKRPFSVPELSAIWSQLQLYKSMPSIFGASPFGRFFCYKSANNTRLGLKSCRRLQNAMRRCHLGSFPMQNKTMATQPIILTRTWKNQTLLMNTKLAK